MRKAGNPSYAGYEYQINVTIWVSLDLMLAKAETKQLTIEPRSQEDIETSIQDPDKALLGLDAQTSQIELIFQVKTRSVAPWSSRDMAKILTRNHKTNNDIRHARQSPLDLLELDQRRRYVFVTNESLEKSLRVHQGQHIFDFPEVRDLPPYAREGFDASAQARLAPRILLCSGVTEEVLAGRIESLLAIHGHVPSVKYGACVAELRNEVRKRISGYAEGKWTRDELTQVLVNHGGSVAPTRVMDHYVRPKSYDRIVKKLDQSHAVVITGPSGTGKTLTADILESMLRRAKPPFTVIGEEDGPGHVRHHLGQAGRTLFHLRDPWGSNRLTPGADRWSGELPKLLNERSSDRKFLITSRSDVIQSAGGALAKDLKPYIVFIEIDDYDEERLQRIYDGMASELTGHAYALAQSYRKRALNSLFRPYEIDRFLVALSREDAHKPRCADDIIADSQIHAISGVITKQIEPMGDDGVRSAAIIWSVLVARGAVVRDVFSKVLRRIRSADTSVRPDVEGLLDFLVAGRNLRQEGASLSFHHPRVEDGLQMAFLRHQAEAEYILSLTTDGLAALDSGDEDWGIESVLALLRATTKLDGLMLEPAPATRHRLDAHLAANAVEAGRRFDFTRALNDLSNFGSTDHLPSRLARLLMEGGPDTDEVTFGKRWRPPLSTDGEIDALKFDARTAVLVERFVREVMPFSHTNYDLVVVSILFRLSPHVEAAFWDALDEVAVPRGPSQNIEVIVAGVCASDSPDFDRIVSRFLRSELEADAWMRDEYANEGRMAEEHEVDAVVADHIMEEPEERYYNSQAGLKAVVQRRREREGLAWIAEHPHRQSLIRVAAEVIGERREPPAPGELRFLFGLATGWSREVVWRAARQHWNRDLVDLLTNELTKLGMDGGSRRILIEIAGLCRKPIGDPVALLVDVAYRAPPERQLELLYDVMRTSITDDGRGVASTRARKKRTKRICKTLDATLEELGRLLIALMSGEEIRSSAEKLSGAARIRLETLLQSVPLDVAGPFLCTAAALGIEFVSTASRMLESDQANHGMAAVLALKIDGCAEARVVLRNAMTHGRYRVRRAALDAIVEEDNPEEREMVRAAASDRSADVRLRWASLMQQRRWPDAIEPLVRLLGDQRNFDNAPGYLAGPSWSEFRVARAAARALRAFKNLPRSAVDGLLEATNQESSDPVVACEAILALADKNDSRISEAIGSALNSTGLTGAPEYRPLAQAAAWALFDRVVANQLDHLPSDVIQSAVDDPPVTAGPLLMAVGISCGFEKKLLLDQLDSSHLATRAELVRISAIADGTAEGLTLEGCEPLLVKLAEGTRVTELARGERANVEAWSKDLNSNRDVQLFTAWIAKEILDLPLSEEISDPRLLDLPERIGLLTTRSFSSAREEETEPTYSI